MWKRLYIVSSMPPNGDTPEGVPVGMGAYALKIELGNVIEITGRVKQSTTAGTLTPLRWMRPTGGVSSIGTMGEWRKWREDAAIVVPSTGLGVEDTISGRYEIPDDETNYWLLLGSDAGYAGYSGKVLADAQGSTYRRI